MPNIPLAVAESDLSKRLQDAGLVRIHQGKVRDTYLVPNRPNHLLVVATNRVSIFDFVLNGLVPDKGAILTALTVFWLTGPLKRFQHHLVAYGKQVLPWLPKALENDSDLSRQALVVKRLQMLPVEAIVRGYLTGSGWAAYKKDGKVCGHQLPLGLNDGSLLEDPIFTPTTKAVVGHDEHIDAAEVAREYGSQLGDLAIAMYEAAQSYALSRGIIIADTKFEVGKVSHHTSLILGDEVLTPDSSRFWLAADWQKVQGIKKSPVGYDKQPLREVGKKVVTPFGITGINELSPENPQHVEFVSEWVVPQEDLQATSVRYHQALRMLTGVGLDQFWA